MTSKIQHLKNMVAIGGDPSGAQEVFDVSIRSQPCKWWNYSERTNQALITSRQMKGSGNFVTALANGQNPSPAHTRSHSHVSFNGPGAVATAAKAGC
jgi:hypothetical protein